MDERPGRLEAWAAAIAGAAFALGAILLRHATLVPAGVFDGAAVLAALWGVSILLHRALGAPVATLTRGVAVAAHALLATGSLLPPFDRAALPLAAWALGAGALQASVKMRRAAPLAAGAGVGLLALGAAFAWIAADVWPETARLRGALVVAAALAVAGLVGRLVLARKAPRLAPSPVGVLLLAGLAASYVAYRPLVATRVANLPLYEWTLGVGAAGLMLAKLRRSARDAAVNEAWSDGARRHAQDALPAYDVRMTALARPIQRYLDTGEGFEEYRNALLRAAPHAAPPFRKTLQGARPVQGRGRAGKTARRERLATHEALMELIHGQPEPAVRAHP